MPTADVEEYDHPIANVEIRNLGTGFDYNADRFMAENTRSVMNGPSISYRWRSEPRMPLDVTFTMTSFGFCMSSRAPCQHVHPACHATRLLS
jgi:hypothetical protein